MVERLTSAALLAALLSAAAIAASAPPSQVSVGSGSVVETVAKLRPGQFVWAPQAAPKGPLLMIVNTRTQRAILYRNGVPIAASTVSTGRPGYRTPTGVFTVLQKHVEHYSSKYDNAPMPYMQRLTWYGIALHAGQLPGYPASHGCVRMPREFARLLYGVTTLGMTVVITDTAAQPRIAPAPEMVASGTNQLRAEPSAALRWTPEKAPDGPVSIVVSVADRRAVVLRNGVEIGSGPVTVDGPVSGTWAYALRNIDASGQRWIRVDLGGAATDRNDPQVPAAEWQRFHAPESFRRAIAAIVQPGTTIVVTSDSLQGGAVAQPLTLIEGAPAR